jgi:hypothetical protein
MRPLPILKGTLTYLPAWQHYVPDRGTGGAMKSARCWAERNLEPDKHIAVLIELFRSLSTARQNH